MKNKKSAILAILLVILILLGVGGFSHAEGTTTTVPTSTIGSIDGPADVGTTTVPTETTVFVNECLEVGGVGQTDIGLLPCELPTTTLVAVGEPPAPSTLPATGYTYTIVFIVLACMLIISGVALVRLRNPHGDV